MTLAWHPNVRGEGFFLAGPLREDAADVHRMAEVAKLLGRLSVATERSRREA